MSSIDGIGRRPQLDSAKLHYIIGLATQRVVQCPRLGGYVPIVLVFWRIRNGGCVCGSVYVCVFSPFLYYVEIYQHLCFPYYLYILYIFHILTRIFELTPLLLGIVSLCIAMLTDIGLRKLNLKYSVSHFFTFYFAQLRIFVGRVRMNFIPYCQLHYFMKCKRHIFE